MSYVDVDGHPTWVIDEGAGDTVVVLHGAFHGSDAILRSLAVLGEDRRLVAFDRRGHGRTGDTAMAFHYADMAEETISVIESLDASPAHLVGYSAGAVVAMCVALRRPELAVIPAAGHTVVWEKPDIVVRLVGDFLKSLN